MLQSVFNDALKASELKEIIPIRRGPWENPPPGKGEIDTVAYCESFGVALPGVPVRIMVSPLLLKASGCDA